MTIEENLRALIWKTGLFTVLDNTEIYFFKQEQLVKNIEVCDEGICS